MIYDLWSATMVLYQLLWVLIAPLALVGSAIIYFKEKRERNG